MSDSIRLLTLSDGVELAGLPSTNQSFLAPWQPVRAEAYFTTKGQREDIESALEQHARGACAPMGILDETGTLLGRITLSGIVRGALLSGNIGYWVAEDSNGLAPAYLRFAGASLARGKTTSCTKDSTTQSSNSRA